MSFENNTKKEIAKFNLEIKFLREEIEKLKKKSLKILDLEAEIKELRKEAE
jgi:cell shape-determining protein MreC